MRIFILVLSYILLFLIYLPFLLVFCGVSLITAPFNYDFTGSEFVQFLIRPIVYLARQIDERPKKK